MPHWRLPVLAVSLLLGSLTGAAAAYLPLTAFCVAALVLGAVTLASLQGYWTPAFGCILFGLFLFGTASAALTQAWTQPLLPSDSSSSEKLDLIGEIEQPVRYGPQHATMVVSLRRLLIADRPVSIQGRMKVSIQGDVPPLLVGDLIRFQSRVRAPHGLANPGGFDYEAYLHNHGIQAVGSINFSSDQSALQVLTHVPHHLFDRVDAWRGQVRRAAQRSLDSTAAALYLALITGESGYLSQEVRDAFMASGTTHILSISGSHLGLIGVVVFWVVHRGILLLPAGWVLRLTLKTTAAQVAACVTVPAVGFYAMLGGAEVATVRSLIMLGIFLGAVLLSRTHHLIIGLALAAVMIVVWDPTALLDLSFQLSFLSVLVIVLLVNRHDEAAPAMVPSIQPDESKVRQWRDTMKRSLGELLLVSAAITGATAPLVAFHFHQFAWVGLIANLVVVPFVGFFIVPLGLLGCLATLLSGTETLYAAMLLQPSLDGLLWIVETFDRLPGSKWMVASPPIPQILVFYVCIVVAIWYRHYRVVTYGSAALAAGLLMLWIWSPRALPEQGEARVTFLDVGQGDAAVIEAPDGHVMLIDGGGASDWSDLGRTVIGPYLWERGIRRLDVVVATHPQLDHVGGLRYVVQEFPIAEFWNSGMSRAMPFVQRLDEVLARRQVPVKTVSTTDPPLSWGPCTITVLNPSIALLEVKHSANTNAGGRDLNNTSVVLRLHCGPTSVLFTADIEQDAEARLLESGVAQGSVLKVPHHGSAGSLHEPFLTAVAPTLAVVSVGRANPYRHPTQKMLETYKRLNIDVVRTDRDGAVTIIASDSELRIGCEAGRRLKRIGSRLSIVEEWRNLHRLRMKMPPCAKTG